MTKKQIVTALKMLKRRGKTGAQLIVVNNQGMYLRYRAVDLVAPEASRFNYELLGQPGIADGGVSCFIEGKSKLSLDKYVALMTAFDRGVRKVVAVRPL